MDLQTTHEEALQQSEPELPINALDLIISNGLDKLTELDLKTEIPEWDVDDTQKHEETNSHTKDDTGEDTKTQSQEETEKQSVKYHLKEAVDLCDIDLLINEKELPSDESKPNQRSDPNENGNENGACDKQPPEKEIEKLWAEAIKAQNEGHYKYAIRNFTAILENTHSTPEIKHKTKCRLVFALYQDNQADEAEKIGWDSDKVELGGVKRYQAPSTVYETTKTVDKEIILSSEISEDSIPEKQSNDDPFVNIQSTINESTLNTNNDVHTIESPISSSYIATQDTKRETPNSTPDDDDESTITRISECSDDSNLIKLDLSQLVGEPANISDDTVETKDINSENEEKGQHHSDKVLLTADETQESTAADDANVEKSRLSDVTSETTSTLSSLTQITKEETERISEPDSTKTTMASTDLSHPKKKEKKKKKSAKQPNADTRYKDLATAGGDSNLNCLHCNVKFYNKSDFHAHCKTEKHQHIVMSDEGRSWKYRPPPRGVGSEAYTICSTVQAGGSCSFGTQCVEAHSLDELKEWKERYDYRQKKIQRAAKLYGKTFVETLLDKLCSSNNPEKMLVTKVDKVDCVVSGEKEVTLNNKGSEHFWNFTLSTKGSIPQMSLRNVALINDANRHHFTIASVKHCGRISNHDETLNEPTQKIEEVLRTDYLEATPTQQQEWSNTDYMYTKNPMFAKCNEMIYDIKVKFKTDIYGTFRQSVVFSFGPDPPYLRQDLCVEVTPQSEDDEIKLKELQDSIIKGLERWDTTNSKIIDFTPPLAKPPVLDELILKKYPAPKPSKFQLTQNVMDSQLTKHNYRGRMHELLFIEEMEQFDHVSQFNVITNLQLASKYLLTPTSTNSSTAKYARPGELFGKMKLGNNLSEDTSAGRLILTNCPNLLITVTKKETGFRKSVKTDHEKSETDDTTTTENKKEGQKDKDLKDRIAYVVGIEDTGKSTLYLRLPSTLVKSFELKDEQDFEVEVQFQLNRLPLCEMHHAVDRLPDLSLVYPDIREKIVIPWSPGKQWGEDLNAKLNPKQREAVVAITTPLVINLPPILIIGPYGTGKTFTLGQAIKMLLKQQETHRRILVCTHSNSAADLYIKEYLHPFIEKEEAGIKLLRVYYEHRWVQTVNQTVQQYCLITINESGNRTFRNPTLEDVKDCDVVVATLSTSRYLNGIGLKQGHFTHILLDEAAQAMECEAVMPLALSSNSTRVVLAGDHMQLSPEVFSQFALEKKFNKSLLERLYDLYPQTFACKILLCENYRSHEAIINYTSELFYEQKLIASGKQAAHETWYPLTMFTARGEDIQDVNSTSFYNNSEVYEVVERVAELQRTWPKKSWGERDENAIGIVTPYYDQVQRIRSELRKRRLFGVSVERVLNVQGKQFRAIFLSTVRTRKTCISSQEDMVGGDLDFGFLSNAKLLNTAITRAQSLVAVVGDPIALCSMGKCRKLWERFMGICHENKSLLGLTYSALRTMLDNVELKKAYVLNPLAPEFIPRSKRYNETFLRIFNDTMKQFLTAAAASSSTSTAPSKFPNVLGGTGLVPPPPMPPFGYQVAPQAFFPPVAGCIPPPPRHPPPPPMHPHSVSGRRIPAGPMPGPFDPYMTVPPLPPIPPPWGMKLPPVPGMGFPPTQIMPNMPIPPPSLQVVIPSSATTSTSQQLVGPNPDPLFGMGMFNNMPMKQTRPVGMMGNPLASSNPNLAQLHIQHIAPPSPRLPGGHLSSFTRNMSPFQPSVGNQAKIPFTAAPLANPHFANSIYQRGPVNPNSPIMTEITSSTPVTKTDSGSSLNDIKGSNTSDSGTTFIPDLDSSFIYLQGGVHFPKTQNKKETPKQPSIVPNKFIDPVQTSQPPIESTQPFTNTQPAAQMNTTQVVDQQNKQHHPLYMKEERVPTWFEMALDILPQDFEITSLLQSPQIQKAWYNQLTISRGPKEASLFQELISNLHKQPDLVMALKEQIMASKLLQAPTSGVDEEINSLQHSSGGMEKERYNKLFLGKEKPAILAEDLEAMLLNESQSNKGPQPQRPPPTPLMSTTQASAFLPNHPYSESNLQTSRQQSLSKQIKQKQTNEQNLFAPTTSSSGDAFFSMMRGNNNSSESSLFPDNHFGSRLPVQTNKRSDGATNIKENLIEDIYNDPILSEILRNSSNSSPDSGVFNNDNSVTSLFGQQNSNTATSLQANRNNDWRKSHGMGRESVDTRNITNYQRIFDEKRAAAPSSSNQSDNSTNEDKSGAYVPLYMRRAGIPSTSTANSSTGLSNLNQYEAAAAANAAGKKYLPLTLTTQNISQKVGHSRFTVGPISSPVHDFTRQTQFEREHSVLPNFRQPPPPFTAPPEERPPFFPNAPPKQPVAESPQQKGNNDPNKPLTYANILRAPKKTAKEKEMEIAMADPINRIRSLGTLANQDDQITSGGARGGFGLGGSGSAAPTQSESILRQEENQYNNAAWFNTFNKQW